MILKAFVCTPIWVGCVKFLIRTLIKYQSFYFGRGDWSTETALLSLIDDTKSRILVPSPKQFEIYFQIFNPYDEGFSL